MTKLSRILLIVLGVVVVFAVILYFYINQVQVGADIVTPTAAPTNSLISTEPATPGLPTAASVARYDWPTTSRLLIARYNAVVYLGEGNASNQISLANVVINKVNTDGTETNISAGVAMQSLDGGRTVGITLPADLLPDTIYHWTVKPSGSVYTASVDTKFMTASAAATTAPSVTTLAESTNATISMQYNKAAFCSIDLYRGTSKLTTLYSGLSYRSCSTDMYYRQASSIFLPSNGSNGLNPSVKTQQSFGKMLELNSRNSYGSSNGYSIKAIATNTKGSNSKTININHIDPVGFASVIQTATNTYKLITEQIYGLDNRPLANTSINITVTRSGVAAVTTAYTTDANGRITIPSYTVDPNKTEFIVFSAKYLSGPVNFPLIDSKFFLTNY